jgi:hypothetical protein
MKRLIPLILILSIFAILAAGCGAEPEVVITPEMILADGVGHMASLAGFEFSITQTGPMIFLDADEIVQFNTAVGHYVAPDQALTTVTITALGMLTEITVISLPETQWASNPLSGVFQELPDTYLFKPTQYLDPTSGFFPSLGTGTIEVVLEGEEELEEMPGLPLTHLSGTIPGEIIFEISKGLIDIESMSADMWLDTATNEVHRVVLTDQTPGDGADASIWTFDFWSFGEIIEISAP